MVQGDIKKLEEPHLHEWILSFSEYGMVKIETWGKISQQSLLLNRRLATYVTFTVAWFSLHLALLTHCIGK
jgi:hypothetical protein